MKGARDHKQALALYKLILERRNCTPRTVECLMRSVGFFLRHTEKKVSKIRRTDVLEYLANRSRVLAPSSQWSELSRIRGFFDSLVREGTLGTAPTDGLFTEVPPVTAQLVLSETAVGKLLRAATPRNSPEKRPRRYAGELRDQAAIELLYGLGLRESEVRSIRVVDLRLAEGSILARAAKRGENRVLPLTESAVKSLEIYLRDGRPKLVKDSGIDRGHLLVTKSGVPYPPAGVLVIVKRVAKKAGLEATPHAIRRSIATHLVRRGANVKAVSDLLGHQSLETTARYVRVDEEDLRRAVEKLDQGEDGRGAAPG